MDSFYSINDARRIAKKRLPKMFFDLVEGGADDELTARANEDDYQKIKFNPRVLVDVAERDLTTTVLGEKVDLPVMLAPTGLSRLMHPRDGELAIARGAEKTGTPFVVSTAASYTLEEIAKAGSGPKWFQLYMWRDRGVTESLIDRAWAAGYRVLCPAVDVPIIGNRERDVRNGLKLPPKITLGNILDTARRTAWAWDYLTTLNRPITMSNFAGIAAGDDAVSVGTYINRELINPSSNWDDIAWFRKRWQGPMLVKGIMSAEDAIRAIDVGAQGIVVSNHGGRQLDGLPSTIEVLPEVVAAVDGRIEVHVDGGIRRGSDVVKAIALGAQACWIGRPYVWGLTVGGAAGVAQVIEILRSEIDRTLALLGCAKLSDLDRSFLR
jgi:isopentenyl diphosphate isomerase/L-lactate dehydrogenase-like FMN-dependent dehydrogenase